MSRPRWLQLTALNLVNLSEDIRRAEIVLQMTIPGTHKPQEL